MAVCIDTSNQSGCGKYSNSLWKMVDIKVEIKIVES